MLNEPVSFPVAGKSAKFRRLSSATRRGIIEAYYIERLVQEIALKAKAFEDISARNKYISEAIDKLPAGDGLTNKAMEQQLNEELIIRFIARSVVEVDRDGAEALYREGSGPEIRTIFDFITQSKKNSDSQAESGG